MYSQRPYEDEGFVISSSELSPVAVVAIIYDKVNSQVLLQRRSKSNIALPNEILFPSEKGFNNMDPTGLIRKLFDEELGGAIPIDIVELQKFSFESIGNWGSGIVIPIVVSSWNGDIVDTDLKAGTLMWVDRFNVMESLTYDPSKLLFLLALSRLSLIHPDDFQLAPKISVPSLV